MWRIEKIFLMLIEINSVREDEIVFEFPFSIYDYNSKFYAGLTPLSYTLPYQWLTQNLAQIIHVL